MSGGNEDKGWRAKAWNLAFLIVGALIAFFGNSAERIWERAAERLSLYAIFRADIAYQIEVMGALSNGLGNLKSGRFPNIAPAAPTLDASIQRATKKVEATLPAHKSIALEATLSKLSLLDSEAVSLILRFYSNLADCEVKRAECEETLNARTGESPEQTGQPRPICDVYLESIKSTVDCGRLALASIDLES